MNFQNIYEYFLFFVVRLYKLEEVAYITIHALNLPPSLSFTLSMRYTKLGQNRKRTVLPCVILYNLKMTPMLCCQVSIQNQQQNPNQVKKVSLFKLLKISYFVFLEIHFFFKPEGNLVMKRLNSLEISQFYRNFDHKNRVVLSKLK